MKVLECSSKGDKRFSAFYAKVDGVSIEEKYQSCKMIFGKEHLSWKEKKGLKPDYCLINDVIYNAEALTPYYKYLWCMYFYANPDLLNVIKEYDNFADMFKGKNSINCQADVIAEIKDVGIDEVYKESLLDVNDEWVTEPNTSLNCKKGILRSCSVRELNQQPQTSIKLMIVRKLTNPVRGAYHVPDLAPSPSLFSWYLKNREKDNWFDDYKIRFNEEINTIMQPFLKGVELRLSYGLDVTLICYCTDYNKCHRSLLMEYFEKKGYNVVKG